MPSLSKEISLLCKSVQFCASKSAYSNLTQPQIEVDQLNRLVRWHGLIGPIMEFLHVQSGENTEAIENLKPILVRKTIDQALSLKQLRQLSRLFERNGINYVVFKGLAAKAQFITPCIDMVRSSADIDLLVSPSDFPAVVTIMHRQGYHCIDCVNPLEVAQCVAQSADQLCKRGLVFRHSNPHFSDVDIHWRAANTFSLPLPTSEILSLKQTIIVDDLNIFAPCFKHHFIILAIHGYLDCFFQLKHLADLFFAMQHTHFNEEDILSIAHSYGVRQQVEESIELTRTVFNQSGLISLPRTRYVVSTLKRYRKYKGIVPRAHRTIGKWTLFDKLHYIVRQIITRSDQASIIAPIQNRFRLKFHQVPNQTQSNFKK